MDIGQATLAKEALKPASSVIDSLLAPKLARLRRWAAERDLKGRIAGDQLEASFSNYLKRLLRRISGINTVVFPQQLLPLPDLYEPLSLKERFTETSVTQAGLTRRGARICIVDSAGMGKSTFVKNLILSQIGESDCIPLFLELRRVQQGETIFETLARDLDEFAKTFDRDVLLRFLSVGRFLIVLDGFDEVSLASRETLSQQIEELASKGEGSALILTARPEVDLPAMSGSRLLEFKPLARKAAESLIRRYDRVGGIDVGERLIQELDKAPERFLRTPLLVALLYKTYGFNGSISTRVSTFYDEMYNALYKGHDLSKAGFSRAKASGLDAEDFRRLIRGFSFFLISKQIDSLGGQSEAIKFIDDAARLTSIKPSSSGAFLEDLLLSVPLLVRDGRELRFLHKTIAEFFSAEYLAYAANGGAVLDSIHQGVLGSRFDGVFAFLSEINPSLFRKSVAARLAHLVLRHEPEERDLVLRTLKFLGEVYASVWPKGQSAEMLPEGATFRWHVSALFSHAYILGLYLKKKNPQINPTAWSLVTSEVPLDFDEIGDIPSSVPLRTWLKIEDFVSRLQMKGSSIMRYAASAVPELSASRGHQTVRVLSNERAQELLESVEEEERTQRWLSALIGDST